MSNEDILAEIKALMEEGRCYHEKGQHLLSLQCYQKAIPLAAPLRDAELTSTLLWHSGSEHRDCDNYYHAIDLLLAALALIPNGEDTVPLRAIVKKTLAIALKDIFGPYKPEVLQLLDESRGDYMHLGYEGAEANVLQHIAGVYIQTDRYPEADNTLQLALRKAQAAGDEQLVGWIFDDMADLEIQRDEWGTALDLTHQSRRKAELMGDKEAEGDTWITEGRVLVRMGQVQKALDAFERALSLYTENKNLRRTIRARRHISKVLVKLEQAEEGIAVLATAMDTAARLDLRHDQIMLQLDASEMELVRKNYGLAREHAVRAHKIANDESLPDLLDVANNLLRRCGDVEGLHE